MRATESSLRRMAERPKLMIKWKVHLEFGDAELTAQLNSSETSLLKETPGSKDRSRVQPSWPLGITTREHRQRQGRRGSRVGGRTERSWCFLTNQNMISIFIQNPFGKTISKALQQNTSHAFMLKCLE